MRRVLVQILAYGCVIAALVVAAPGPVVAQPATPATDAAPAANEALVERYYELFNAGAFDQFAEVLAPDFVVHTSPPGEDPGIAGLVAGLAEVRVGLPDITITVDDLVAEGNTIVARTSIRGTHSGDFFGLPPTGKVIETTAIDLWRSADGKLTDNWHLEDFLAVWQQLGMIPGGDGDPPAGAASAPATEAAPVVADAATVRANKALAQRFHEDIFVAGDLAVADEILAPDFVWHSEVGPGPEGVKQFATSVRAAFPDLRLTAEQVVAEGDRVAILWTLSGTHQAEFFGVPGTGRAVSISGIDVYRIADGRIAELWTVGDDLGLLMQLGAIPAFGGDTATPVAMDEDQQGAARDETAIRSIPEQIMAAWAQGNGEGIAAVFAEEADFIVGDGSYWQGRAEIAANFEAQFGGWLKGTRVVAEVQSVRFLSDEVALMRTTGGILMPGESEVAPEALGIQTFVVTQSDGTWLVAAYQNTRIQPQP